MACVGRASGPLTEGGPWCFRSMVAPCALRNLEALALDMTQRQVEGAHVLRQ
jgi:hypothetical protein